MTTLPVQHQATLEFLNHSPSPKGRVVDVGCGDGFASRQFVERGADAVFANDYMEHESDVTDLIEGSEFLEGIEFLSMSQRPSQNGQTDLVWCHHCLEHQERPIDFLKELHALLKPSGELWLAVPNMRDNLNLSPDHTMAYNMPLLIEHLRRASFNVEDGAYWVNNVRAGHLRVRLGIVPMGDKTHYPKPMRDAFDATGRCPVEVIHNWNWFPEKEEVVPTDGFTPVPDHEPGQIDPDL